MQSFTAIPPWPLSVILPAVLAVASSGLTCLLYQRWQEVERQRDRDPGSRQLGNLKWLPRISMSVAITSIVIAVLIGVDRGNGGKARFIIGTCYLQVGSSACLLVGFISLQDYLANPAQYEGSTAIINKMHFLSSWPWARRLLRPSYSIFPTSVLSCILVMYVVFSVWKPAC